MWYIVLTLALVVVLALVIRKAFKESPVFVDENWTDGFGGSEDEKDDTKGDVPPINQ